MKADVTDAVNLRGKRAVVAMDFRRARVYATDSPGHSRPEGLETKDPWHLNHNLYHREDNPDGTYDIDAIDTDDYFKTLAVELRVADEVLLLGHGKGKSNASVQFGSYLDKHYPMSSPRWWPSCAATSKTSPMSSCCAWGDVFRRRCAGAWLRRRAAPAGAGPSS